MVQTSSLGALPRGMLLGKCCRIISHCETWAAQAVDSSYIVKILNRRGGDGRLYLAMEYNGSSYTLRWDHAACKSMGRQRWYLT